MEKTFNKLSVIVLFILPAFLVFTSIVIVSVIWVFFVSFTNWNGFGGIQFDGLSNYAQLFFHDRNFWLITGNTFKYTFYELLLQIGGGLLVAIFLTRLTRMRASLQTFYYIPVIISSVAICQIFNKLLSVTPAGVVNSFFSIFNPAWIDLEWISNPKISLEVCAFVEGYKYFGLYMVIFYSALISVPKELIEAATIDGASAPKRLVKVQLPYIKPVIIANFILVLNGSMRSFDISYLLTKGGPGNTSQLLSPYMYKQAFSSMKYGYGSSVAIAVVLFCVVIGIFLQKTLLKDVREE